MDISARVKLDSNSHDPTPLRYVIKLHELLCSLFSLGKYYRIVYNNKANIEITHCVFKIRYIIRQAIRR